MDQINDQEDVMQVTVKNPFVPKFFKQLDNQPTDKSRKNKKKGKSQNKITFQGIDKTQTGIASQKGKNGLHEVNRGGNRIVAKWQNDQINGQAEVYYNNGVSFKGVYQNGMKVKGHFKFLNGYEYIGNCLGNKFDGEGALIFPSGKTIKGQWKGYNLIGKGEIKYPHGELYFGQISNFKKNGNGELTLNDGSRYVGEFKDGLIHGYGTYYVGGQPVSKGEWINGQLTKSQEISATNQFFTETKCVKEKIDEAKKRERKAVSRKKDKEPTSIGDLLVIDQESNKKKRTVKFIN